MSAFDLTAARAELATLDLGDGAAGAHFAEEALAEVERLQQVNAQLQQHARDEHAQGWSEATAYLYGLAASTTDDKETVTLWRAAEKLRGVAKELRATEASEINETKES